MPADRCPTCDREGCPAEDHWKQYRAAEDAGNYDLAVESLALFDECGCELVDWRARALAAEADADRWRKVAPLIANLHRAALIGASHTELIAAVAEVTAATQEPTP